MIALKIKITIYPQFNPKNDPKLRPNLTNSFQMWKIFLKFRFYVSVFFTDVIVGCKILKIFQKIKKFVIHKYFTIGPKSKLSENSRSRNETKINGREPKFWRTGPGRMGHGPLGLNWSDFFNLPGFFSFNQDT